MTFAVYALEKAGPSLSCYIRVTNWIYNIGCCISRYNSVDSNTFLSRYIVYVCIYSLAFQQNSSNDVSRLRIMIRSGGIWLYDDWECLRYVCWDTWTQQIASTAGDNRPVPQCLQLGPTVPPHRGCMYAFFSVWWVVLRWGYVALQYVDHEVDIFGFHQIILTKFIASNT